MVVIIDPGHGGKDPGAVSKGIREKDVVLGIGLKLGKYISEQFPDVKVIFTRNTDVFVPLIDRSKIANKSKADLFISLHANFCGTPSTRGTETFVLGLHRSNDNLEVAKKENSVILLEDNYKATYEGFDPNSSESYIMFELVQDIYMDQSVSFADDIQHQFKTNLEGSNRGVKQAGFLVLRQSSMPSVLVETGFLSNQTEANYLKSDEGQKNIALSILDAFRKFKVKNSGTNSQVIAETKKTSPPVKETSKIASETPKDRLNQDKKLSEAKNADTVQNNNVRTVNTSEEKEIFKTEEGHNIYYSVQIAANTNPIEPIAVNFKGLKDVRREKTDKYYRYYVGKEESAEDISTILQQVKSKFPQAFIVSFVNGTRSIVK